MSKKNKKSEITPEATSKKNTKKAPVKGIAGLRVAQAICYVLTFPVMIALSLLICYKIGDSAPYYSFWPYVGAIIMAVFGLIFLIVALIVNRKGTKRKAMQRTVSMLICVVVLTGVFGLAMDLVFPDVIQGLSSKTLFVEDLYNNYEYQADRIIGYTRQYIRLNLVNGNYDGNSYDVLKNDADILDKVYEYEKNANDWFDYDEESKVYLQSKCTKGLSELDIELYDWIYTNYILTDYDYAFDAVNKPQIKSKWAQEDGHYVRVEKNASDTFTLYRSAESDYVTARRHILCRVLVDEYSATYKKLCEEGVQTTGMLAQATTSGNAKMSWIYTKNYASMDLDGYLPLNDDCGLGYATGNRMTIPVVLRLILNDHYTVTDATNFSEIKVLADGKEDTMGGYFVYMHKPEIAEEIQSKNKNIEYVNGVSTGMYEASDGNSYLVYEEGGYVEGLVTWCVLDMLGDPMAVASMGNLEAMIGDLLAGLDMGLEDATGLVWDIIDTQILSKGEEILNGNLENVIVEATNGQRLYLSLCYNDQGQTEINLIPQAIEQGYLGYQYMTWMESGHLLVTICGVMSLRNLLLIFGAVAVVMVFAIGTISAQIEKKREDAKKAAAEQPEDEETFDDVVLDEIAE